MECERFQKQLSLLRDHELDSDNKALLEEHLKVCPDCASMNVCLEKIDSLYRTTPAPFSSIQFVEKVMGNVKCTKVKRHWFAYPKLAAAILIFLIGGAMGGWIGFSLGTSRFKDIDLVSGKMEDKSSRFPYFIKMKDAFEGYCLVIQNENDEKEWRKFWEAYTIKLREEENKKRLNQYRMDSIPASLIYCGDF